MKMKTKIKTNNPDIVQIKPTIVNQGLVVEYKREIRNIYLAMAKEVIIEIISLYKQMQEIQKISIATDSNYNIIFTIKRLKDKWINFFNEKSTPISVGMALNVEKDTDLQLKKHVKSVTGIELKNMSLSDTDNLQLIIAENVALIKSIPEQYLKNVEISVYQALKSKDSVTDLKNTLMKQYRTGKRKAELLAEDQINKAVESFDTSRLLKLGVEEALWVHAGSYPPGKPRIDHVKAGERAHNGETYNLKKGMLISGEYIHPKEKPYCRCDKKPVIRISKLAERLNI